MSVINRVLVDLEKRHAHSSDARASTPEIRAVGTEPGRGGRKVLLALLIVFALASIAVIAWQWTSARKRPEPAVPPALVQAPAVQSPPPAPAPATAQPMPAALPPPVIAAEAPVPHAAVSPPPLAKDPEAAPESSVPSTKPKSQPQPAVPKAIVRRPEPEAAPAPEVAAEIAIEKRDRPLSASERAEAQFRQGALAMQRGRMHDAEASFLAAIAQDPSHLSSRQALLGLYLEAQRKEEAEVLLRDGFKAGTRPPSWVMLLARLEADRGDLAGAVNTLQSHLDIGRQNGEYLALLAALLQKQGRHKEAVEQYQGAIELGGAKPAWFMGQGISLRELGRREEASAAFQRALDGGGLSPEVKLYVERQISALRSPP